MKKILKHLLGGSTPWRMPIADTSLNNIYSMIWLAATGPLSEPTDPVPTIPPLSTEYSSTSSTGLPSTASSFFGNVGDFFKNTGKWLNTNVMQSGVADNLLGTLVGATGGNKALHGPGNDNLGVQITNSALGTAKSAIALSNPIAGLVMKGTDLLTNIVGNTDGMTAQDSIVSNIPGLNVINALFGKTTETMNKNDDLFAQVGSGYGGTEYDVDNALKKSNKKYGLFSNPARKRAEGQINEALRLLRVMGNIAEDATLDFLALSGNSDIYSNGLLFRSQGGWNNRMTIGLKGMKIFSREQLDKLRQLRSLRKDPIRQPYEFWLMSVPSDRLSDSYDLRTAYEVLPLLELEQWKNATPEELSAGKYHLSSVYKLPNGDYEFLKLGNEKTNPEVHYETQTYYDGSNGLKETHDLVYDDKAGRYYYRVKKTLLIFKSGGKVNVIPEGSLHARLHHMDMAGITKKGIPVVSFNKDGSAVLLAEIERCELILNLDTTKELEKLWKEGTDESAIKAGKILVELIFKNTVDNTGLIKDVL